MSAASDTMPPSAPIPQWTALWSASDPSALTI
jgi:hypothetical protein